MDFSVFFLCLIYSVFPAFSFKLEWALQRIKFLSGATNTGQALQFALDTGFQGARGGAVPKVIIVLTDGQSQDEVAEAGQSNGCVLKHCYIFGESPKQSLQRDVFGPDYSFEGENFTDSRASNAQESN